MAGRAKGDKEQILAIQINKLANERAGGGLQGRSFQTNTAWTLCKRIHFPPKSVSKLCFRDSLLIQN